MVAVVSLVWCAGWLLVVEGRREAATAKGPLATDRLLKQENRLLVCVTANGHRTATSTARTRPAMSRAVQSGSGASTPPSESTSLLSDVHEEGEVPDFAASDYGSLARGGVKTLSAGLERPEGRWEPDGRGQARR